jgi:hypothetical protein
MRKLAILALAGLVLAAAAVSYAAAPGVNDQTLCNINHERCRAYTLNVDAPWYKVMVLLTACDFALGKCMLGL